MDAVSLKALCAPLVLTVEGHNGAESCWLKAESALKDAVLGLVMVTKRMTLHRQGQKLCLWLRTQGLFLELYWETYSVQIPDRKPLEKKQVFWTVRKLHHTHIKEDQNPSLCDDVMSGQVTQIQ